MIFCEIFFFRAALWQQCYEDKKANQESSLSCCIIYFYGANDPIRTDGLFIARNISFIVFMVIFSIFVDSSVDS